MDIRQLQYLAALAREKHFTRAAAACNVTQPTLSGRIRQLEQELGVSIVKRGQRYQGLTPEGERVLKWALSILEDCGSLEQELAALKGELAVRAVLGVVPSALPTVSVLTEAVRKRYPRVTFSIQSLTSREILRNIADFSIDVGISYLDNEPIGRAITVPMYDERYRLFVRDDHPLAGRTTVSWNEAADHPLGLLTPDMQNRRIVDATFARIKRRPDPEVESNS
ncbi:MAG: LysR family transcriptional regulator, partial [Hyphomicrobiales bacterium]